MSDLISLTHMISNRSESAEPTPVLSSSRSHPPLQNSTVHAAITHRHNHLSPPGLDILSRSSSDSSLHQTAYQNKIISGTYRKGKVEESEKIVFSHYHL